MWVLGSELRSPWLCSKTFLTAELSVQPVSWVFLYFESCAGDAQIQKQTSKTHQTETCQWGVLQLASTAVLSLQQAWGWGLDSGELCCLSVCKVRMSRNNCFFIPVNVVLCSQRSAPVNTSWSQVGSYGNRPSWLREFCVRRGPLIFISQCVSCLLPANITGSVLPSLFSSFSLLAQAWSQRTLQQVWLFLHS